jgi:hypothetical protein
VTVIFSSRLRKRTSKRCLHFRHLYSYIGMDSFLAAGVDASVRLGETSAHNLDAVVTSRKSLEFRTAS